MLDMPMTTRTRRETVTSIATSNLRVFPQIRAMVARHAPRALEQLYASIARHPIASRILPGARQRAIAALAGAVQQFL